MWLRVVYDSYLITTTFCENNKLSVCLMSKWCGSARRCLDSCTRNCYSVVCILCVSLPGHIYAFNNIYSYIG